MLLLQMIDFAITFFSQCISKWLNEQRPECPLCNKPAILPDLFEAPAGLTAADFPSLGLS